MAGACGEPQQEEEVRGTRVREAPRKAPESRRKGSGRPGAGHQGELREGRVQGEGFQRVLRATAVSLVPGGKNSMRNENSIELRPRRKKQRSIKSTGVGELAHALSQD